MAARETTAAPTTANMESEVIGSTVTNTRYMASRKTIKTRHICLESVVRL